MPIEGKWYCLVVWKQNPPTILTFKVPKLLQEPDSVSCGQKERGTSIKNILTGNDSDSFESTQNAECSKCCQIAKVYSHCDVPVDDIKKCLTCKSWRTILEFMVNHHEINWMVNYRRNLKYKLCSMTWPVQCQLNIELNSSETCGWVFCTSLSIWSRAFLTVTEQIALSRSKYTRFRKTFKWKSVVSLHYIPSRLSH